VAYWLRETYAVGGDGIDWLTLPQYKTAEKFAKAYRDFKDEKRPVNKRRLYTEIREHLKEKGLPEQAWVIMTTALLAEVSITDLLIQIKEVAQKKEKNIMFGMAIYFRAPLPLLPNINVDKLSFLVQHSSTGKFDHFPKRALELGPPASFKEDEKATGSITFNRRPEAEDLIRLGGTDWGFGAKSDVKNKKTMIAPGTGPGAIIETVKKLAGDLNTSTDTPFNSCTYEASGKTLKIAFDEGGSEGNDFQLKIPEDLGTASASTLRGGGGARDNPVDKPAKGSITFSKAPASGDTITLGGTEWKFGEASNLEQKTTKIGTGNAKEAATATIINLANDLSESTDTNIKTCTYKASEDKLIIEYNGDPADGNNFQFKITGNFGEPSSGKLKGGESAGLSKAKGSITFKDSEFANLAGKKISVGGGQWEFVKARTPSKPNATVIGENLAATVTQLAADLKASETAPFPKCTYTADGDTLVIEFTQEGEQGNSFDLKVDPDTIGEVSPMKGGAGQPA
jgi:hypothetical protein